MFFFHEVLIFFTGVMNLVVTATGDPAITDKIVKLSHNVLNAGVSISDIMSNSSEVLFCLIFITQIFEI